MCRFEHHHFAPCFAGLKVFRVLLKMCFYWFFPPRDENKENYPDKSVVLEESQAVFQDTPTPCNGTLRIGMGNLKSRKPTSIPKTENGKNREENQVICLQIPAVISSIIKEKPRDYIFISKIGWCPLAWGAWYSKCSSKAWNKSWKNKDNVISKHSSSIGMRWERFLKKPVKTTRLLQTFWVGHWLVYGLDILVSFVQ